MPTRRSMSTEITGWKGCAGSPSSCTSRCPLAEETNTDGRSALLRPPSAVMVNSASLDQLAQQSHHHHHHHKKIRYWEIFIRRGRNRIDLCTLRDITFLLSLISDVQVYLVVYNYQWVYVIFFSRTNRTKHVDVRVVVPRIRMKLPPRSIVVKDYKS